MWWRLGMRWIHSARPPAILRDPVLLALFALGVLTVLWFLVGPGGLPLYWLEQVGLDMGAGWLAFRVANSTGVRPIRRFWRAMGTATIFFSAADGYQAVTV